MCVVASGIDKLASVLEVRYWRSRSSGREWRINVKSELRYTPKPDVRRLEHGKKDVSYSINFGSGRRKR